MKHPLKTLLPVAVTLGLSACAMGPREGPPAPVVQVTPRPAQPARAPKTALQQPAPGTQGQPLPSKRPTQVFAYRDPSLAPEPTAGAPPAGTPPQPSSPALGQPVAPPPSTASPAPIRPSAPAIANDSMAATAPPATIAPGPAQPPAEAQPPKSTSPVAAIGPRQVMPISEQPGIATSPSAPLPQSNVAAPELPPAAAKLAAQAEQHRRAGDYAAAAAALERSLRIAPRDPYLLNRLARVRLEQGQAGLAANLAARANDLAGGREDLRRDNWRIIAESKRRIGDEAGAHAAEQRAGP